MPHFDHASLSPPHPAALTAMAEAPVADPTRLYAAARRARHALDDARAKCATALGARAEDITFTSGGTEAIALAVTGAARAARAARRPLRIVTSAVEQRSILDLAAGLDGFEVVVVPVDPSGRVAPQSVADAIGDGAALVCMQVANGEIGTLQPVAEVAALAKQRRTWVLADATYAAGWIPLDVAAIGADLVTVSGSRCGGPPGTGFLWARPGVRLRPLFPGDDRERGVRAGMPNLPGLVGLGAGLAARTAGLAEAEPRLRALTDRLRSALPEVLDEVIVHGDPGSRLPHVVSFTVPLVEGDALLLGLDREGFAVHSGSACTSATNEPSHVLAAIGTLTHGAVRVSIGPETETADVERFLSVLPGIVGDARATLGRR